MANNQFRLEFFQKEPVGGKVASAEYNLYMADKSGAAVSEVRKFVADKTSPERADRIVRVTFVMLAGAKTSAKETYYLTAVEQGHGNRGLAPEVPHRHRVCQPVRSLRLCQRHQKCGLEGLALQPVGAGRD